MATEITAAHLHLLHAVVEGAPQMKALVDQFVACSARITQNPALPTPAWSDAANAATRLVLRTELVGIGTLLNTFGAAALAAANGVDTDWT